MVQVNTVGEYLQYLQKYKDFSNIIFRGQSSEYNSITCSVSRNEGHNRNESNIFHEILGENRKEFKNLKSPLEYLAKMQHYGIPTRLVDFTTDPLVALYFAVKDSNKTLYDSNIYIYIQKLHPLHNKHIRLLALLSTLDSFEIINIINSYQIIYHEKISEEEILQYASTSAFIERSEVLQKHNDRIGKQFGTFAICGNKVSSGTISKELQPLTEISPTTIIRIPFEHKQAIKAELDITENLNESSVYPELFAYGNYIADKYWETPLDLSDTFRIEHIENVSFINTKRVIIKAFLKKRLPKERIEQIATKIIKQYKNTNDVIFIFLAKTETSLIVNNWILRGQWIRESLDPRFWPHLIGTRNHEGIILRFEDSYSVLEDYHEEYTFESDKLLFIKNMKTFRELEFYYKNIKQIIKKNDYVNLKTYALENSTAIAKIDDQIAHFGFSKDNELNQFLESFQEFTLQVYNIVVLHKRNNINDAKTLKKLVLESFLLAKGHYKTIKKQAKMWQKLLHISDKEYTETDLSQIEKKEYVFRPTMPINPEGLNVTFNLNITKNKDCTLNIKGTTNLFDAAKLLLSINDCNNLLLAQNKSKVENGIFDFGQIGRKEVGFQKGKYQVELTLSSPSQQDKIFISKAGTEYENLLGPHVDRDGISPIVSYTKEYEI